LAKTPKEKKKRDPMQIQRFKDTARELGADESGETFERAFKKIVPPKSSKADQ
jgi:hypothetical protein